MATMYSIFFSVLLTAVCGDIGFSNRFLNALIPGFPVISLRPDVLSGTVAERSISFICVNCKRIDTSVAFHSARCDDIVNEISASSSFFTSSRLERSVIEGSTSKVTGNVRNKIINIASKELGVREATGNNDGLRIEEYLRYTNLSKGYEWCAAFISWVYGQAGLHVPRNPWSPALFPKARLMDKGLAQAADVFGIYGISAKRINHVGLVKEKQAQYILTIEGNSNDRVESRRRHLRTVHAMANWVD